MSAIIAPAGENDGPGDILSLASPLQPQRSCLAPSLINNDYADWKMPPEGNLWRKPVHLLL